MKFVRNKCILVNPKQKFGADPSCHLKKKNAKNSHFNSEN